MVTNLPLLGAIVGLVVLGKLVVWTLVVWLFERPFWTALRAAVGLTQIGEFSFILVQVARTPATWPTTSTTPPWPPRSSPS